MYAKSARTPLQKAAPVAMGLAITLSSMELVPGWGGFRLGWPPEAYYAIVAAVAAFAGAVAVRGYSIPGLFAGPAIGMGALAATTWHLAQVSQTWSCLMVIVGVLGALPGIGLFFVLKTLQDAIRPGEPDRESSATPITPAWLDRQSD